MGLTKQLEIGKRPSALDAFLLRASLKNQKTKYFQPIVSIFMASADQYFRKTPITRPCTSTDRRQP